MPLREQENLPYRTPGTGPVGVGKVSANEEDYSTAVAVRDILKEALTGLFKDFNAFDILKDEGREKAADNLLRQVEAKQMAFDILSPTFEAIDNAVKAVDEKWKQRNKPNQQGTNQ